MSKNGEKIHPTAVVDPGARLGKNVSIGAYSVVHAGAEIGDDTVIQEHCSIGVTGVEGAGPLALGAGSFIRTHTVLYADSTFGENLETGHHVVIREKTRAGANLRVGNFSDIEGNCTIGDYCRFHGYVHVGKGSRIGHFVWLFSLTTATNDPLPPSLLQDPVTIDDGAVVCVGVTLMPGITLGKGAFASAGATVRRSVPAGAVVAGSDGRVVNHVSQLLHLPSGTRHPWMRHYRKGYPPAAIARLEILEKEILANRFTLPIENE